MKKIHILIDATQFPVIHSKTGRASNLYCGFDGDSISFCHKGAVRSYPEVRLCKRCLAKMRENGRKQ